MISFELRICWTCDRATSSSRSCRLVASYFHLSDAAITPSLFWQPIKWEEEIKISECGWIIYA